MSLRIAMMATGEFALPSLKALVDSDHQVVALITQPDRVNPRGKIHPHPVKEFALSEGISVLQPASVNKPEIVEQLEALNLDVIAVAAYGQILSANVIKVPRLGMYNLHGSLLPRHRGAAPVQYSVWMGDELAGITIFQIEPKLDAGPMILKRTTPIGPEETSGELHDRLAEIGAEAFVEAISLIESGDAVPLPQNSEEVTLSPKIKKEQGEINWELTPREIDCHIRAMQPWPNPYTYLHRQDRPAERLLILKILPVRDASPASVSPGTVIKQTKDQLLVQTGDGVVSLEIIQRAGKKPMQIGEFLRGTEIQPGDRLGPES